MRWVVGDDNFKAILAKLTQQFAYKSIHTEDFRKVAEAVSGQDLRSFFIQWIESTGAPEFKLEYTVFRTKTGFRIMGKVNQDLDTFRMPVDVRIETEGNPEEKRIEVVGTSSEFVIETFGKPKNITIDDLPVLVDNAPDTVPYETQQQRLRKADEYLIDARHTGDVLAASFFSSSKPKAREKDRQAKGALLKRAMVFNYDPTCVDEENATQLEISPTGELHLHWGQRESFPSFGSMRGRHMG